MNTKIKIGFVLLSSAQNPIPSTRISVLNVLPFLHAAHFDPRIIFESSQNTETPDVSCLVERVKTEGFQIVYFQKLHGPSVLAQARELREAGIRTVFGVCDAVEPDMVEATDLTVTVTDYLKSLYPSALQSRITTVHDGIERPWLHKTDWGTHSGSRTQPLRAVLVTSLDLDRLPVLVNPPGWLHVTIVGRYSADRQSLQRWRETRWQMAGQAGWRGKLRFLNFLTNPRIQRVAWEADGVYDAMQQADIGIIPVETDPARGALWRWQVKSENRLTLMMAMGLPVIATPIPAYEPVIRQGQNGYLANNKAEWLSQLSALRDPTLRQRIGQQARQTALAAFSMERQAEKLISVLHGLVGLSNAEAPLRGNTIDE